MVYTYLISYSINGGELQQEIISAGSMQEAISMFEGNMRMSYTAGVRIHTVWVLLKEFKIGDNYV